MMKSGVLVMILTISTARASEPLVVKGCESGKFWAVEEGKLVLSPAIMKDPGKGWALVEFVIESTGKVTNAKVLQSAGNKKFDERALALASAIAYVPSAGNQAKVSIRTQMFSASRDNTAGDKHRPVCGA